MSDTSKKSVAIDFNGTRVGSVTPDGLIRRQLDDESEKVVGRIDHPGATVYAAGEKLGSAGPNGTIRDEQELIVAKFYPDYKDGGKIYNSMHFLVGKVVAANPLPGEPDGVSDAHRVATAFAVLLAPHTQLWRTTEIEPGYEAAVQRARDGQTARDRARRTALDAQIAREREMRAERRRRWSLAGVVLGGALAMVGAGLTWVTPYPNAPVADLNPFFGPVTYSSKPVTGFDVATGGLLQRLGVASDSVGVNLALFGSAAIVFALISLTPIKSRRIRVIFGFVTILASLVLVVFAFESWRQVLYFPNFVAHTGFTLNGEEIRGVKKWGTWVPLGGATIALIGSVASTVRSLRRRLS